MANYDIRSSLPLVSVYRIRRNAPGFGICLFKGAEGQLMAADGRDGLITGFVPVNTTDSILYDAPAGPDGCPLVGVVGNPYLHAFQRIDGTFAIGSRAEVEAAVSEALPTLRDTPFTWEEAAGFVRDEDQLRMARLETSRLLQRTAPSP